MKADFFYECLTCKVRMPAAWDNVSPAEVQSVSVAKGEKVETTFRCQEHREPEASGE